MKAVEMVSEMTHADGYTPHCTFILCTLCKDSVKVLQCAKSIKNRRYIELSETDGCV